jgi:predicted RND superfamily exporter protein
VKWAIVGYTPLLFTILLIYGVVGFIGKDFDMPISVLSCLSLGMAVDFAIHFISRFRQRVKECRGEPLCSPSLDGQTQISASATTGQTHGAAPTELITDSLLWTAARPGKGIMRNAVLFASSFSVMMFASLTPYITVGAFIVSMMLLSAIMTIIYLPALITLLQGWLGLSDECTICRILPFKR